MTRKTGLFILIVSLMIAVFGGYSAQAQGNPDAWTSYQLNMRTGPGGDQAVVVTLPGNTGLMLEARNEDASWLLAHTQDGASRGWVASLYLRFEPGVNALNLPVSSETIGAAAPATGGESLPAETAGGVHTTAISTVNVRSGPGTSQSRINQLRGGVGFTPEGRNADGSWVLGHTDDNLIRGWVATQFLRFTSGSINDLALTVEVVGSTTGSLPAAVNNVEYQGVRMGGYDASRIANIDLAQYPIVARATGRSRQIFLNGRALGNNPNVIAKVGDCSSEHWYFLSNFGWGDYNLADHGDLQAVVDHFGESLAYNSEATHNGFNVNAVLHPGWSNPAVCQTGESPLQCEYRIHRPSVSIIMFGTSDLLVMTPYEFDFYMRDIVNQTIEAGVIPVLSTFPGNQGFRNQTIIFNQVVVRIALDYDIPLINLWLALEALPNEGLQPDGFHLGETTGNPADLSAENLLYGYPTRNLVTLQSLDAIWRGSMQ
jgi:uncharacterized protein YraI